MLLYYLDTSDPVFEGLFVNVCALVCLFNLQFAHLSVFVHVCTSVLCVCAQLVRVCVCFGTLYV